MPTPITDAELLAPFDFSLATNAEKLDRAEREGARAKATGKCTDYEREMMLADRASDNDEKMWHSGLAAKHLKAHPGQCNCAARYAAIADLKRKLTKQN